MFRDIYKTGTTGSIPELEVQVWPVKLHGKQSKKNNPIPKPVKLADLKYNSDFTRLVTITEKDLERIEKYR